MEFAVGMVVKYVRFLDIEFNSLECAVSSHMGPGSMKG